MSEIPSVFPVTPQDIFNYLTHVYFGNNQLQCVLRLQGIINEEVLQQAIRTSLDVQPILGCRLIENDDQPNWKKWDDFDELEVCSIIKTNDVEDELQKFIQERNDVTTDCQLKVKVFRNITDTICIKINHACCDAGGLNQYVQLLVSIYDQLFENGQYNEKPHTGYCRGQEQFLSQPAIAAKIPNINPMDNFPGYTVALPYQEQADINPTVVIRQIPYSQLNVIKNYARNNNATLNDVLLTAFNRSLASFSQIKDNIISICSSADLRKHLSAGKTAAICNLSGMNTICSNKDNTQSFDQALADIVQKTRLMKENIPGLHMALFFQSFAQVPFKDINAFFAQSRQEVLTDKFSNPWLSNIGILSENKLYFGQTPVEDCYMVGPAFYAPGLMLIASTYNNTLTLAINFYQSTFDKNTINQFLDSMLTEINNCK